MIAEKINPNDSIGICSPCSRANVEKYNFFISEIKKLGFQVKESIFLYSSSWKYSGTCEERMSDLYELAEDSQVKIILFGGGPVGNEFLHEFNYDYFIKHPKRILSYSNGTWLLNAISMKTGLETYYGQFPGCFKNLNEFDHIHFNQWMIQSDPDEFYSFTTWHTLHDGIAEGICYGGLSIIMQTFVHQFPVMSGEIILFLENHEQFCLEEEILSHLASIEQSTWMPYIKGVLIGCYNDVVPNILHQGLAYFGQKHNIPIIQCNDFGHGKYHGILPIGRRVILDATHKKLYFK